MENEVKKLPMAKFNATRDEGFELWSTRMEAYLVTKGVFAVVSNDMAGVPDDEGKIATNMALAGSILIYGLGDKPLWTVMSEKINPHVTWVKLREPYATFNATTRVQLQTRRHQVNYFTSLSMSEYVDSMEAIFNRMEGMGCTTDESMKVATLLASFGDMAVFPYGPVISPLETLSDDKLNWETTTSRLLQEYETKRILSDAPVPRNIGQKRFVHALKAKANIICYNCGKKSHSARNCFAKRKHENGDQQSGAKAHETSNQHSALVTRPCNGIKTIIDSGASSHMVADVRYMKGPLRTVSHRTALVDGKVVKSTASGRAIIYCESDRGGCVSFELSDVLYVLNLDTNLLSCSKFDENGHEIRFKNEMCTIRPVQCTKVFTVGACEDAIYQLSGKFQVQEECRTASVTDDNLERVWQNRLRHGAESIITDIVKKGTVQRLKLDETKESVEKCGHCLRGKQTRLPLKERSSQAAKVGEITHSDVCGPMPIQTLAGKEHFVSFIDGFTGFRPVYLISKKAEVLDKFREFVASFERKYECQIKSLYSDNGGEYEGMQDYLTTQGIDVVRSAPYTPE